MRQPSLREGGFRAYENPLVANQLQDVVLTTFVLTSAALEEEGIQAGLKLFPETDVGAYRFKVPKVGDEHLVIQNFVRGYRSKIKTVNANITADLHELLRHTAQGAVDDDELLPGVTTPPIDAAARASALARKLVQKSLEARRAALVADEDNFGLVMPITAGNGWNEAATSLRTDIGLAADYLEGQTSVDRSRFSLALFGKARQAARENEGLRSAKLVGGKIGYVAYSEVAEYLNIKEVWGAMPVGKVSPEAPPTPLYGDVAILYYSGSPSRLASIDGDRVWGRTFTLGPGVALNSYRDDESTSLLYPWQKREKTIILDPTAAVLITGVFQE